MSKRDASAAAYVAPPQSPYFRAANSGRYERQSLIAAYEDTIGCRLAVMVDAIYGYSVMVFEDLIYDANPEEDLHLIISSPGGDGEAAVRLVRSMQSRCRELTVIIPNQAKSAATLLALGAHHILMAPFSDLGPVDAQIWTGQGFTSAKDLIAAVDDAAANVLAVPGSYPFYVSLLEDITAIMTQEARSAQGRSHALLTEALRSNPDQPPDIIESLVENLRGPLIDQPQSHAALFSADDALRAGLPVKLAIMDGQQWRMVWQLWTMYFALSPIRIYEGRRASHILAIPEFER